MALLIFALGAGVSAYEGVDRLLHPVPIERPAIIFGVLAASLAFEGASWLVGIREFRAAQPTGGWWQAFRRSKDPPTFIVVFEDSAAILGIVVAAAGTAAALLTGDTRWDGVASLAIAAILAGVAALLARESKALLIGERADPSLSEAIMRTAGGIPGDGAARAAQCNRDPEPGFFRPPTSPGYRAGRGRTGGAHPQGSPGGVGAVRQTAKRGDGGPGRQRWYRPECG